MRISSRGEVTVKLDVTKAAFDRVTVEAATQPAGGTHIDSAPAPAAFQTTIIFCKALRIWHHRRTEGEPVQPALYTFLASRGLGILAPVFDGLFSCAELALGRPTVVGTGCGMSSDEAWIASLIGLARRDASGWTIPDPQRKALLDGAARSARIMLHQT
jgi:hypothetical protein